MILECCGQWMAPLWQLGRAGSLAWAADHLWCDTGLWLVEADHVTRLLASDWLTESDVGGPVVGPAWPLSSKVNDFNQFLITDHTPDQDQWDKLGHSGPQHLSPAFPPQLCVWMPFWRGSRKVGVRCVVLTWPGAVTTATLACGSDSGQIVSSHGHGAAYWNFLGLLCTTHDEMMRDPSGVTKFQEPERQSTDGGERGGKVFGLYWPWYWHNSSRLCRH